MHAEGRPVALRVPEVASRLRHRRELLGILLVACGLVLARSAVYIADNQAFFDSDQAITGLMAKHLLEGRAFPLFFYGQAYLLAVQAWLAVPFFALFGPTVPALMGSVVAVQLVVATLIIIALSRDGRLRPAVALAAALFYVLPASASTFRLVEAGAANGMPFLYVLLLWYLRQRPLWLGATAAIGFLNREFTIYALPMLLLDEARRRTLFSPDALRRWGLTAVAALAVVQTVQVLKPFADYHGPGTRGQLLRGFDEAQTGALQARLDLVPEELPARAWAMLTTHIPRLLGAEPFDDGFGERGHPRLRWPIIVALMGLAARVGWLVATGHRVDQAAPAIYLAGTGLLAAVGYVLTRPAYPPIDRYFLLVLLLPVGVTAACATLEPRATWRRLVIATAIAWGVFSAADHVALARDYVAHGRSTELQHVIDRLRARGVRIAEAGYWRAYKLSFLAREDPKVASTDFVRIDEYQHLANEAGRALVSIREQPCAGGEAVGQYYLCPAGP